MKGLFNLFPAIGDSGLRSGYSVVCCVRFSADGKFLATGCNRTAQIYDTKSGAKVWCVEFLKPLQPFSCRYSVF